ncbi:MAG: helix-turn-helix domain-containing protein [Saprospiraceae bacterium]
MDNSLQNELRQKMRELRDLGGYSQQDMADAMEITQPSFCKVQNGDIELAIRHISGFCELLCVAPTEFIALPVEDLALRIKRKSPPPPPPPQVRP